MVDLRTSVLKKRNSFPVTGCATDLLVIRLLYQLIHMVAPEPGGDILRLVTGRRLQGAGLMKGGVLEVLESRGGCPVFLTVNMRAVLCVVDQGWNRDKC
ncbi:hypothetical protein NDU88_009534 [Pleurodeles waltl]|uniref:Uncharacterized protein n=1 Tax=Pleurodeles waltl TaxID=8319 RepID=A0AAV7PZP5_PLEWA|nr:hypothetical protein NDU88_009534 [Pleurodeles waltl]